MFRRTRALFSRPSSRIASNNRINRNKRLYLLGLEERTVPTTFVVSNLLDDNSAGSLRGAIALANADATPGPHVIDATGVSGTITLSQATINIAITATQDLTINGPGAGSLTISAGGVSGATTRTFNITSAKTISINNVTITGGNTTSGNNGAAIINSAANTLNISGVTFNANKTAGSGGVIAMATTGGKLSLTSCTVSGNSATGTGGAINLGTSTTVTINGSTISGNSASSTGAFMHVASASSITINNSTIASNTGSGAGAAINLAAASTVNLTSDSITANSSASTGGAINVGTGASTITATSCTFSGNVGTTGGAVHIVVTATTFSATSSTFINNRASTSTGGAIHTGVAATVTLNQNQFISNTAAGNGGAIRFSTTSTPSITINTSSFTGNTSSSNGGGIYFGHATGPVIISGSTFANNSATTSGGGIHLAGAAPVTINNSTFSGNVAKGNTTATGGGAINSASSPTLNINNSTLVNNTAVGLSFGGGIRRATATGTTSIISSIVAKNSAGTNPDMSFSAAVTVAGGANLVGVADVGNFTLDTTAGPNLTGTLASPLDPLIAPLGDHGGATLPHTFTHSLVAGSPALGAGNQNSLPLDQAGNARPAVSPSIGSFEGVYKIPTATPTLPGPVLSAGGATFTVTVVYGDDVGVDTTTLNAADLTVTGPGFGSPASPIGSPALTGSSPFTTVSALYTFNAPGGAWAAAHNGSYTVTLVNSEVSDVDVPTPNTVPGGSLGTFLVGIPSNYVVDNTGDVNDGDYTAGKFTLREALALANTVAVSPDTITFGGAAFAGAATITLTAELPVNGSVTITGTGASNLTITGNSAVRIFNVADASQVATVNLNNMRLASGKSGTGGGGAILNAGGETLNITGCILENNNASAGNGGAIGAPLGGAITIASSTIRNNSVTSGPGGAIDGNANGGSLTITDSTFSGNTATTNGGAISVATFVTSISRSTISGNKAATGGGLSFYGGTPTINNSTISSNTATANGGGIALVGSGTPAINVRNSTITANTATTSGGGIARTAGTWTVNLYSTIVYGNLNATSPDLFSTLTIDADYCDIGDSTGVTTFNITNSPAVGTNPLLGPLQANGGPTLTQALSTGSPALDAGDNTLGAFTTDQRGPGFPRIIAPNPDIGAFEGVDASPAGNWTPIGPIVTPGATPNTIDVSWADDVAILQSSLGTDDISIKAPDGSFLAITGAVPDSLVNGTPIKVTYTFTVPGGSWGTTFDSGTYTVSTVAGKVADTGATTNKAVTLGTFLVDLAANIVVDEATDIDDGDFTVGKRSFREAVVRANIGAGIDTITFSAAVFNVAKTIAQASAITISQPVDIIGPAASLTFDATATAGIRHLSIDVVGSANNPINISKMTFKGGSATTSGGSITMADEDLTLTNVIITGNKSTVKGGGINVSTAVGTLTLVDSVVSNNQATGGDGGGINFNTTGTSAAVLVLNLTRSTVSGNTSSDDGGGIYFFSTSSFNMTDSTLSGNTCGADDGGGAYLFGTVTTITNSTIAGNKAADGGGGLAALSTTNLTVNNSTIANNISGASAGGGIFNSGSAVISVVSSIVAKNTGATGPDIKGVATIDFCLIGVDTGATLTDTSGMSKIGTAGTPIDPLLGALANNGGPTLTMLPAFASVAIKAGSNPLALTTDQRGAGFPRELTVGMPNIGAVEGFQSAPSAKMTAIPPISVIAPTPNTVVVTYADNNSINWTTIDVGDIEILNPSLVPLTISSVSVDFMSNGTPRVATYTFAVPGGGWEFSDNGTYTVNMKATQVSDLDPLFVPAGSLGSFSVSFPVVYLVDEVSDTDDANLSVGKLSLREAIKAANSDGVASVINFDPAGAKFGSPQSFSVATEMAITESVTINAPAALLTLNGTTSRFFNVDPVTAGDAVSISGMTLQNAVLASGNGGAIVNNDGALILSKMTITGNTTPGEGGGISVTSATGSLNLTDCVISGNKATASTSNGGGIDLRGASAVTMLRCTVSGNEAGEDGGGIYFFSGGSLAMTGSTVSGNKSNLLATSVHGGGGIYFFGTVAAGGFTITNSTISNNISTNSPGGGLVLALFTGNALIQNSTVTGNTSGTTAGGGIARTGGTGTLTLSSSIVAGNTAGAGLGADMSFDVAANVAGDDNLVGVADVANFTLTGVGNQSGTDAAPLDAKLGLLANNGGSTQTHALLAGSPALNAGNNVAVLSNDQRGSGFVRVFGATADIGAFEDQPVVAPAAKVTGVAINSKMLTAVDKAQRSYVRDVAITFDSKVAFAGTPEAAFTLNKIGGGSVTLSANVDNSGPGTVITLTFTGGSVNFTSLADGRYAFHALAAQFTGAGLDGDGNGTGGDDYIFDEPAVGPVDTAKIFRIFGDYTGDGNVAAIDFVQFRLALGNSAPPFQLFDFDNDGAVAASDFIQFRLRFGGSI